ncbi:DoxX family protein [uncultured Roseibium sp.]|uniref:DoxX family protein n=1 Tax=uncultured Roseibium sp. TaxID=1936171 RepID=UPI002634340E|nr:DoxX family protein [uncultured Roseibium sp.]
MTLANETSTTPSSTKWNIGLWVAAVVLSLLYAMSVYMKLFLSHTEMVEMGIAWAENAPLGFVRFIGAMELLGIIGLILPAATRIMPKLTIYAAVGLAAIQVLAIPFHMYRGEFMALPFNLIYLGLAVLIIWGRSRKAVIVPRA